jgi:hypothetical protein
MCETDSDRVISVAGSNCSVLEYYGQPATADAYSLDYLLTINKRTDMRDDINRLLDSMKLKISDQKSDADIINKMENGHLAFNEAMLLGDEKKEDIILMDKYLKRLEADEYAYQAFEKYLSAEILTDQGGTIMHGILTSCK